MNLKQIIENIDKSKSEDIDWDSLMSAVNLNNWGEWYEQERLKCYWYANWCCTDTHVGYKSYFLDDKLVAVSHQPHRKLDEMFQFISKEAYYQLKQYVKSLEQDHNNDRFDIIDIDSPISEGFHLSYTNQLFDRHKQLVMYLNKPYSIIDIEKGYISSEVLIKPLNLNKPSIWVDIAELVFPWYKK